MTQTINKRSFYKNQPTCIAINQVLGSEAKAYVLRKFSFIATKLHLNAREMHFHPFLAFARRYFNQLIVEGYCTDRSILDIGASLNRNYTSAWKNIWSMSPIIDGRDIMRDMHFRDRNPNVFERDLYARSCRCVGTGGDRSNLRTQPYKERVTNENLDESIVLNEQCERLKDFVGCPCRDGDYDNIITIDAIYEPGVHEELLYQLKRRRKIGYFTMMDFDKFRRSGRRVGRTFDNEASVTIDGGRAILDVVGNPSSYEDRIVNTFKNAWQFFHLGIYFLFEIVETLECGDLDYVIVRVTPLLSVPLVRVHEVKEFFYSESVAISIGRGEAIPKDLKTEELREIFSKAFGSNLEKVEFEGEQVQLTVHDEVEFLGIPFKSGSKSVYKAKVVDVLTLIPKFMGRFGSNDLVKNTRVHFAEAVKGGVKTVKQLQQLNDTAVLATHLSAVFAGNVLDRANKSIALAAYKKVVTGLNIDLKIEYFRILRKFLQLMIPVLLIYMLSRLVPIVQAMHKPEVIDTTFEWTFILVIVFLLSCFGSVTKKAKKQNRQRTISGSCVFDSDRLKLPDNVRFKPNFEFHDETWRPEVIECDAKDRPLAHQVAPLFVFDGSTEPTIKHPCKKVALAASIRACSNKVFYDDEWLLEWQGYFRKVIIPLFTQALDHNEVNVTIDGWLRRYPQKYQDNIRRVMKNEDWQTATRFKYQSFPKVELQFTEVDIEFKETVLNTVKERQISGPPDTKKILANPIINALENLAHVAIPQYCGMKCWSEICESVEKGIEDLARPLFGAADGSGFDMTQFPEMHKMVDELISTCMDHVNFYIADPLSKEGCMAALHDSRLLNVEVGRGAVSYKAQGRASGDGWTTFGNTVLMMSYWMFTFKQAGVLDYFLLVKGDDVLFALNEEDRYALSSMVDTLFLARQEFRRHGLGQICKFIHYGEIEEMDFLSNYFFYGNNGRLRMSRIPARVFQSISWSTKVPENCKDVEAAARELCFSKGHSLLSWSRGLPIFEVLANKMISLGSKGKLVDSNMYVDPYRIWGHQDDREAYMSFLSFRFGMCAEAVAIIERRIDAIDDIFEVVELPELRLLF